MYRIVSDGEIISLCDKPRFVKKKATSGCYIVCSKEDAEAVAVNGKLYNLPGKNNITDRPEVSIDEVDGGEFLFSDYVEKRVFSLQISSLEDALCEIDQGE